MSTVPNPLAWVKLAPHVPVVRRTATEFQVGLDPRTALLFDGPGFGAVLGALDGQHSADALRAVGQAAGLSARHLSWTVNRLRDAGLLAEPRNAGSPPRRVRLIGAGPIGAQLAGHLAGYGVELHIYDDNPPDPDPLPDRRRFGSRLRRALLGGVNPRSTGLPPTASTLVKAGDACRWTSR